LFCAWGQTKNGTLDSTQRHTHAAGTQNTDAPARARTRRRWLVPRSTNNNKRRRTWCQRRPVTVQLFNPNTSRGGCRRDLFLRCTTARELMCDNHAADSRRWEKRAAVGDGQLLRGLPGASRPKWGWISRKLAPREHTVRPMPGPLCGLDRRKIAAQRTKRVAGINNFAHAPYAAPARRCTTIATRSARHCGCCARASAARRRTGSRRRSLRASRSGDVASAHEKGTAAWRADVTRGARRARRSRRRPQRGVQHEQTALRAQHLAAVARPGACGSGVCALFRCADVAAAATAPHRP
jgi:hypothetical protein